MRRLEPALTYVTRAPAYEKRAPTYVGTAFKRPGNMVDLTSDRKGHSRERS